MIFDYNDDEPIVLYQINRGIKRFMVTSEMVFFLSYKNLLDFITFELISILKFSLYYTSFAKTSLDTPVSDPTSSLYNLVAISFDIGFHRLFKPVFYKRSR